MNREAMFDLIAVSLFNDVVAAKMIAATDDDPLKLDTGAYARVCLAIAEAFVEERAQYPSTKVKE